MNSSIIGDILIGSNALKYWFPDARESNDYDYISDSAKDGNFHFIGFDGMKFEYYWLPTFEILYSDYKEYIDEIGCESYVARPELLYTLKLSHAFFNVHWEKTMHDICFFQERNIQYIPNLLEILYKEFEKLHGKKKAYLAKSNDDFFNDNVNRMYVHDDLHLAVAYGERPLYESIKKDLSKAAVSVALFLQLPRESQLQLCREEIYVTALERFLIPRDFRMSKLAAYRAAAKQLVTSMSSGWFPRFIILNWLALQNPDIDYVAKFNTSLDKGFIRKCH
jgi:hypothetical protein